MNRSDHLKSLLFLVLMGGFVIGVTACGNRPGGAGIGVGTGSDGDAGDGGGGSDGGGDLGDPDIDVSPLSIAFNDDDPTSTNPASITVNNNGTRVLSVSETTLTGSAAFSITDGGAPFTVAAGATHLIEITFGTISVDTEAAILTVTSDDPDESAVSVQLLGGASNVIDSAVDQDRSFGDLFADPGEPDYFIDGSISISGDVEIEPGVTLAFEPGATITVSDSGSIHAVGTADEPIVFTGTVETPGNWIGINVFSNNPLNEIRFAQVSFGGNRLGSGQSVEANVYVQSTGSLSITDSSITDGRGYGIAIEDGAVITEFARNSFARNQEAPLRIPTGLLGSLDDASTFAVENANEYIDVFGGDVDDDAIWKAQDVPYHFEGTPSIAADVVILPGFVGEFETNAGWLVADSGSLSAVGTAASPITLTGAVEAAGQWRGVNIFSANPLNELTHCVIAYAGSSLGSGQSELAGVYLQSTSALTLSNTSIESSGGFGLSAESGASLNGFSTNRFTGNVEAAVYIPATLAGRMDAASTFMGGNGMDWVNVRGAAITADAQLVALDVPYRFEDNGTTIDAAVTIEAGATLAFASNAGIAVSDGGSLAASGSSGDPILFTADSEYESGTGTAGYWRTLNFFSASPANVLDNVVLEFGGGQLGSGQSQPANLYIQSTGNVTLTNSTLRSSGGWATYTENGGTLTESGNTFSGNASGDVGTP